MGLECGIRLCPSIALYTGVFVARGTAREGRVNLQVPNLIALRADKSASWARRWPVVRWFVNSWVIFSLVLASQTGQRLGSGALRYFSSHLLVPGVLARQY